MDANLNATYEACNSFNTKLKVGIVYKCLQNFTTSIKTYFKEKIALYVALLKKYISKFSPVLQFLKLQSGVQVEKREVSNKNGHFLYI